MSVVFSTKSAAVIDHKAWISKIYESYCTSDMREAGNGFALNNFHQLFDLRTPFMMDGQAEKVAKQMEGTCESGKLSKKRKREDDTEFMEKTIACEELSHIEDIFSALRVMPEFRNFFQFIYSATDMRNNNKSVRDVRKRFTEISGLRLPVESSGSTGQECQVVTFEDNKYILPPSVNYICDDVNRILSHTSGNKYDLVVMDPPWRNKYIRRRKNAHGLHHGYETMNVFDIIKLPLGDILSNEALVVIWCSNNKKQIKEITEGLCNWGVDLVATWYWLKVTRGGEPVTPLRDQIHGKRPYERILLARRQHTEFPDGIEIPDGLVFCSVPSGVHSHKPPLSDIVKDYIPSQPNCLEIFARSLVPGWTSYGLEVLKLQHSFLYHVT